MSFAKMRNVLEEVNKSRQRGWNGSQYSNDSSMSVQQSDDLGQEAEMAKLYKFPSSTEMLQRVRSAHSNVNFEDLAAGPEKGGPWKQVEAADRFVVFKHPTCSTSDNSRIPGLEVMCAGRLDTSLEEVASVLRSNSEIDHANTMEGLHSKNFIFGSLDREVPCSTTLVEEVDNQDDESSVNANEQLNVKTSSFKRTTLLGRNEQWCFSDFFQRKKERDGFTISQCALPPFEPTPGRVVGENARVDQLHGLNASYLVDQLPNRKGLRVVYNAWFEDPMKDIEYSTISSERSMSSRSSSRSGSRRKSSLSSWNSSSSAALLAEAADGKAQLRRLLSLAHGVTKLPDLVRRRRFGFQVPADLDVIHIANTRCPCCTHSLAPVKMSFSQAAMAIANRNLPSFRMDTRRCYLCGYLVCIGCWKADYMETTVGRVVAIVVCTRCHASVKACDYSEVCTPEEQNNRGPVKVVEDGPKSSPAALLADFLAASLANAPAGSTDRAAVVSVVRSFLRQIEASEDEKNNSGKEYDGHSEQVRCEPQDDVHIDDLDHYWNDESNFPPLEACEFANAEQRKYPIKLPDDPEKMVPPTVIPSHEDARLQLANELGLLQLAHQLAPLDPTPNSFDNVADVSDLDVLCHLAVRASGCPNTFLSLMGTEHLHILSSSNRDFVHATMPREHTVCQHTIMTTKPLMVTHPEADVRFHELGAIKALSTRCYIGFPLTVPVLDNNGNVEGEMAMGTLCCVNPTARGEITRSQYVALKRIAATASSLIQLKARQVQQQQVQVVPVRV